MLDPFLAPPPQLPPPLPSPMPPRRILWSAIVCWILIAALVAFVGYSAASRQRRLMTATVDAPPNLELRTAAKFAVAQRSWGQAGASVEVRDRQLRSIDDAAHSYTDQLAAVVMDGELRGPPDALRRLNALAAPADAESAKTAEALRQLYADGPARLSAADRQRLVDRLDWFGSLALTQSLPDTAPQRRAILRSSSTSALLVIAAAAVAFGAIVLGFGGLITLLVLFSIGKLRCRPNDLLGVRPPRLLHVFVFWAIAWIGLSLAMRLLGRDVPMLAIESLMALIAFGTLAWPVLRGDRWTSVRHAVGLHRGAGVFVEIGWGIIGYLSGLPLVLVALVFTVLLNKLAHVRGTNPIADLPAHVTFGYAVGLYLTAAVLAPILEELLFRGALYGHLRQRRPVWFSALVVSFIFAAIHPQGWTAIPVLGTVAVVLALLREWRGSLIASMTGHAINNGFLVTMLLLIAR